MPRHHLRPDNLATVHAIHPPKYDMHPDRCSLLPALTKSAHERGVPGSRAESRTPDSDETSKTCTRDANSRTRTHRPRARKHPKRRPKTKRAPRVSALHARSGRQNARQKEPWMVSSASVLSRRCLVSMGGAPSRPRPPVAAQVGIKSAHRTSSQGESLLRVPEYLTPYIHIYFRT